MLCLSRFSCQGRAIAKTCSDICSELFLRLKYLCMSSCSRLMYLWRDPAGMKTLERACCVLTCWVLIDTLVSSCGKEMSASGTWQQLHTGAVSMQAHPHMHTGYAPWCAQKSFQTAYNPVQGQFSCIMGIYTAKVAATFIESYQVSPGVKRPWRSQRRLLLCRDMCVYSGRVGPHDSVQKPKQALRLLHGVVWPRIAPGQRC